MKIEILIERIEMEIEIEMDVEKKIYTGMDCALNSFKAFFACRLCSKRLFTKCTVQDYGRQLDEHQEIGIDGFT